MNIQTLDSLLLNNVLDLKFIRRTPSANKTSTRRMLCTKSYDLLNSTNGRIVLNYSQPKSIKQFNEATHNACVVWDILMQDFRIVPVESVSVIKTIPADEAFWKYFNSEIYIMSREQKMRYMES
jgi:hypothetical protein